MMVSTWVLMVMLAIASRSGSSDDDLRTSPKSSSNRYAQTTDADCMQPTRALVSLAAKFAFSSTAVSKLGPSNPQLDVLYISVPLQDALLPELLHMIHRGLPDDDIKEN